MIDCRHPGTRRGTRRGETAHMASDMCLFDARLPLKASDMVTTSPIQVNDLVSGVCQTKFY